MSVTRDDPRMANPEFREEVARRDAQRHRSASESFRGVCDAIERWVGVTVDAARLDLGELNELRGLVAKVTHVDEFTTRGLEVYAWNIAALDRKETKRFEKLVEKGCDVKNLFKDRRATAELEVEMRAASEIVRKESRPRRPKLVEPGTVQLPGWLADWLGDDQSFGIADLGWLAGILLILENRVEWLPGSRFEGDALVINMDLGLAHGLLDPDQLLTPRRRQFLQYLHDCKLLKVEQRGVEWAISRGPALLYDEQTALAKAGAK